MLTRTYASEAGLRVRLRLARRSDAPALAALLAGTGVAADDLELCRLLTFDPMRRRVLCAFAPIDGAETLVGIGAVDLVPGAAPDTLIGERGITELLRRVLAERALPHARRVA